MEKKRILGILLGDPAGIGPELVAKAYASGFLTEQCRPVIICDRRVLDKSLAALGYAPGYEAVGRLEDAAWKQSAVVLDLCNLDPANVPVGTVNAACGRALGEAFLCAAALCKAGKLEGVCFAPLTKAAYNLAGYHFSCEAEWLKSLFPDTKTYGEINYVDGVWTTRVTSHIPLSMVSSSITTEKILDAALLADQTLRRAGCIDPKIAVSALNPHAGESGLCGREEIEIIAPAIEQARALGIRAFGPISADVIFIKAFHQEYDAVVSMYHDQGQIAMKLKNFESGVTILGGFPAPFTTPAHGSAFDIAGKGLASPAAFESALKIAVQMCEA